MRRKGPSNQVLEITDFGSPLVQQSPFFPKSIQLENPVEEGLRNKKGQFAKGALQPGRIRKGEHRSVSTEFKKGCRCPRPIKKGVHTSPSSEFQPAVWRKVVNLNLKRSRVKKKRLMVVLMEDVVKYLSSHGNIVRSEEFQKTFCPDWSMVRTRNLLHRLGFRPERKIVDWKYVSEIPPLAKYSPEQAEVIKHAMAVDSSFGVHYQF